jgi:hypothetical protein
MQIISAITNIKVSGIATMSYWSILKTADAIYFVHLGTTIGLGPSGILGAVSVLGDVYYSRKSQSTASDDLDSVLSKSNEYYSFSNDRFGEIHHKKRLFGGKITFSNGKQKSWTDTGVITLKLSSKKYKSFIQMLNR